jgi:hypothetical protein
VDAQIVIESVAPVIPVRDLDRALERYEQLGFTTHPYRGRLSNSNGLSSAVVTSLIAAGRFGPLG